MGKWLVSHTQKKQRQPINRWGNARKGNTSHSFSEISAIADLPCQNLTGFRIHLVDCGALLGVFMRPFPKILTKLQKTALDRSRPRARAQGE